MRGSDKGMARVVEYSATVSYRNQDGKLQEEEFPLRASDYSIALDSAVAYVVQVMKLQDFELRVAGS
jgi:hypothetical protein